MKINLEFATKEPPLKIFKKVLISVRAVIRLKNIGENIQTYGTSSNLFDLSTRDRGFVKNFLYPPTEQIDQKKYDELAVLPFPLIHPKGKLLLFWSPIVIILLIYTTTLMPFMLVFYDVADEWSDPWYIFQNIVDILFWTDLLINMFSTYYDEEGSLVKDRKTVILNYIKTWFLIDLLACIPFDVIENAITGDSYGGVKTIHLVKLSKLPRLYRILKIAKIFKIFQFAQESIILEFLGLNSGFFFDLSLF